MARERPLYLGPRLRRLRRELGLTQSNMADDMGISASYVALLERNQRPVTADLLLKLARIYKLDMADLAGDGGADHVARVQGVLKDPIFAGIDLPPLEVADVATSYPGFTEALLRLHTAYRQEQEALADRGADVTLGPGAGDAADPVAEARRFLTARRNCFPLLEDVAERLAADAAATGGIGRYLTQHHGLRIRRLPPDILAGAMRRYDRHRSEIWLDDRLDGASQAFQLATQLAYLEMRREMDAVAREAPFESPAGEALIRRALASYAAAALVMPYTAFAKAVETKAYDVEAVARQFEVSFEQAAHRFTTLQKPGHERVPFFFLRIDPAGNVSKRLDGAGFPFARHGGACPLWSIHQAFRVPREIVTQWVELPDGERFFTIARTVTAGGGAYGADKVERAIALGCAAEHAGRLVYTRGVEMAAVKPTPIGITCRLCHRANCAARAAPPIGREVLADDYRRSSAPYGLAEG